MIITVIAPVALIALFVLAVVVPKRSKKVQGALDDLLDRGKATVASAPEPVKKMTDSSLNTTEKAADKTSEKGREMREKE